MSIFFLLVLTGKVRAGTDKYIFIGDSRTYHMVGGASTANNYDSGNIQNGRAMGLFAGKVIKSHGIGGAWYPTFFCSDARLNKVKQSLNSAPSGTRVIIWLGVNDLNNKYYYSNGKLINTTGGTPQNKATAYVDEAKKLAKAYPKLEFYYVAVTWVNLDLLKRSYPNSLITNTRINDFNVQIKKEIANAKLSNLTFISVNSELKDTIINNTSDGLHYNYTANGYTAIANAIYKNVKSASDRKDTVAPTLSSLKVTSPSTGTYIAGKTITMVATYSEDIYASANKTKITKTTAPVLKIKFGSGTVRTASFSSIVDGNKIKYTYTIQSGDNGKLVKSSYTGTVYDDVGNVTKTLGSKTLSGYPIIADTTVPTCEITASKASPTNASSITYTFTWSENVKGFTKDDITVTNGTKGTFAGSGKKYTLVVNNSGSCTQKVSVAAGKCTDVVGNKNKAASLTRTIDRTSPTCKITASKASPTNASSITYTFTWSENVKGFTKDDITVTNGTKGTFAGSGKKYTLVVKNSGSCTQKVSVAAGKCTDVVGNKNKAASLTRIIDRTAPTITVTRSTTDWTKASVTLTIKAKDNISGLNSVTVNSKAATKTKVEGGYTYYTYKVTTNGTYTILATDKAGNKVTSKEKLTNIDTISPNLTVRLEEKTLTIKAKDDISGLNNVTVNSKAVTKTKVEGGYTYYTYNVTANGKYTVIATDKAGNKSSTTIEVKDGKSFILGDINGDGKIDEIDLGLLIRYITNSTKWNLDADKQKRADVNGDGKIDEIDLGKMVRYITANSSSDIAAKHPDWLKIGIEVKYAVQIYGIQQDVDANDNPLGLTFGPATGADYNNAYVTHEYEPLNDGSGKYKVKIVTHNVASDGSETLSTEYLKDGAVTRTEEEKNKYNVNIHELTWAQIAEKSQEDPTQFLDCMLCGDTKSVKLYLNNTIASGTKQIAYGDGAGVLYDTIDEYYREWNPSSSENTEATNGDTCWAGSNARDAGGYSTSHIRATLIGKENSSPDVTYAGDVNLSKDDCLYSCIESSLQKVITAKKVKYVTGSHYTEGNYQTNNTPLVDKIWLFSDREVYGPADYSGKTTEGLGSNGVGYDKFGNSNSKYYMSSYSTNSTDYRKCYYTDGSVHGWWLRSPDLYDTNNVRDVNGYGNVYNYGAGNGYGLTLGFCIK